MQLPGGGVDLVVRQHLHGVEVGLEVPAGVDGGVGQAIQQILDLIGVEPLGQFGHPPEHSGDCGSARTRADRERGTVGQRAAGAVGHQFHRGGTEHVGGGELGLHRVGQFTGLARIDLQLQLLSVEPDGVYLGDCADRDAPKLHVGTRCESVADGGCVDREIECRIEYSARIRGEHGRDHHDQSRDDDPPRSQGGAAGRAAGKILEDSHSPTPKS